MWLCRLLVVLIVFAVCIPAEAQQPAKVPRIGYLSPFDAARESARSEAIRQRLRELGYIEGQNIAIEYRYAEGKNDPLPGLAAELVRLKVDVILVAGDLAVQAAKKATKTIPIIMIGPGSDPVEAGFVESLARPGANVTGITNLYRELGGKRLELLKEAIPKLARVAVLYNPANRGTVQEVKEILPVEARTLKIALQPWEVRDTAGFETVFATLSKQRPDGLYVPAGGSLINGNLDRIGSLALKSRLPSMYYNSIAVETGGLMSYGPHLAESYRRVAYFVEKILKGAKAAELPVEQPTKFELVINLKTAKQIGLTIPPNVLARADKVIK